MNRSEELKARHDLMRILEFIEGYVVPREPGSYVVIDEQLHYQTAEARFNDDDFTGFFYKNSEYPIRKLCILAWAKLPESVNVLKTMYAPGKENFRANSLSIAVHQKL